LSLSDSGTGNGETGSRGKKGIRGKQKGCVAAPPAFSTISDVRGKRNAKRKKGGMHGYVVLLTRESKSRKGKKPALSSP
jgi:hypothetical protein